MTDFLTEIPRWVVNLGFWVGLVALIASAAGILRTFRGFRGELDDALRELYAALDELKAERDTPVSPLSAPLSPSGNVVDIPTTQTAVARTDEAVEGLKATIGLPTDPNKIPHQPPADTEQIHTIDPGRIASNVPDTAWAYVLSPDHRLEVAPESGRVIPAFRDPDLDFPTTDQITAPTHPDLHAVPHQHLNGATRLAHVTGVTGGRHRHPEDNE
jgi:hypothetical protein